MPQIVLTDPDWFFWAFEKDLFKAPSLAAEAAAINYRAQHIGIPNDGQFEVEYSIHPSVEKLAAVIVVPKGQAVSEGPTYRTEHFDLSMPRRIAPYDKKGGKIMRNALKRYVFGDPQIKLTADRCEAFFGDDRNFVLGKR